MGNRCWKDPGERKWNMGFDKDAYEEFLIGRGVIGFPKEPMQLKSGRLSPWYANLRGLTDSVRGKDTLVGFVLDYVESVGLELDFFYGVPEGATKLALFLTDEHAERNGTDSPLVLGRGRPKEHGEPRDRFFVGNVPAKSRVVVIEDVTTTGDSLLTAIEALRTADAEILAAIGLVNRMELRDDGKSVEQKMGELGVRYLAMSDALALLPLAAERLKPGAKTRRAVEEYFREHGIKPLTL